MRKSYVYKITCKITGEEEKEYVKELHNMEKKISSRKS